MKVAILLSTLLVATAYAITTDNLAGIKVPTAKDIGTAFAKSEDSLLRQAGENMLDPADTTTPVTDSPGCGRSTQTVGPCTVAIRVCSRTQHFPFVMFFTASACVGDVCGVSTGNKYNPTDATQEAIYNLMLMHPPCACVASNTTIGTCNFNIDSCFQLDTTLTNPAYYASATCTKNAVTAKYCCAASGEDAAKDAMTALAGKMNIQTTCM